MIDVKQKLKSDTHKWNLLQGVFAIIELKFGLLEGLLGDWWGLAFIVTSIIGYLLREKTTMPVEMK
jgi:hypothetical protein